MRVWTPNKSSGTERGEEAEDASEGRGGSGVRLGRAQGK